MRIGNFARTVSGEIFKIKSFKVLGSTVEDIEKSGWFRSKVHKNEAIFATKEYMYAEKYNRIEETSEDLIDLIHVRDLLYVDIDAGFKGGLIVPRIAETERELNKFKKHFRSREWFLVGIVTYENIYNNMQPIIMHKKTFSRDDYEVE